MVLGKASRPKSDYGVYRSDLPRPQATAIPRNSLLVGQPEVEFLNAGRRLRRVFAHDPGSNLTDLKPTHITGRPARVVNSDLHNFDSGAEGAAALRPRQRPGFRNRSVRLQGEGSPPCRADMELGHVPGALPRGDMLRAVGGIIVAAFSNGENFYAAIYVMASTDFNLR